MDWVLPWTPGGPAPALLLSCKTVATSIGMNLSGKFELLNVNCMVSRQTEHRYLLSADISVVICFKVNSGPEITYGPGLQWLFKSMTSDVCSSVPDPVSK